MPPEPAREFRAVWIATVDNIDFPSKKNLSVEEQKAELIRDLDLAREWVDSPFINLQDFQK